MRFVRADRVGGGGRDEAREALAKDRGGGVRVAFAEKEVDDMDREVLSGGSTGMAERAMIGFEAREEGRRAGTARSSVSVPASISGFAVITGTNIFPLMLTLLRSRLGASSTGIAAGAGTIREASLSCRSLCPRDSVSEIDDREESEEEG